jgi:hypothetical protein
MIPAIGEAINASVVAASGGGLAGDTARPRAMNEFSGDINGLMTFW